MGDTKGFLKVKREVIVTKNKKSVNKNFFHPSFRRRGSGEVEYSCILNPSSILPLERGGGKQIKQVRHKK